MARLGLLALLLMTILAAADPSALMTADRAFVQATADKRLEGFRSFLAEDAATLRPDVPIIKGRDAVAGRWAPLLNDPAIAITWEPSLAAISDSGDLGYTAGSYEITRQDEKGKRIVGSGKYITIWKKQRDGSWKVVFDSGVPDTPPK